MDTQLETQDVLQRQVQDWPGRAEALVVQTSVSYVEATAWLKEIVLLEGKVKQVFGPLKDRAFASHRAICTQEKAFLAPLAAASVRIRAALVAYDASQAQARRDAQRLAEQQARAAAEAEQVAEAARLEALGHATGDPVLVAQAHLVLDAPTVVLPVVVQNAMPVVEGLSYRDDWDAQVTDLRTLARAVGEGLVPIDAIDANAVWLRREARQRRDTLAIPGVKAVCRRTAVLR